MMNIFKVRVEDLSPILVHKFNGQDESKRIKELSIEDQAEAYAYRNDEGLYAPSEWFRGCLINQFIEAEKKKKKGSTKNRVSPRIQISPPEISLGTDTYKIDKRSASSGGRGGGTRDWVVRPIIHEWAAEFTLRTTIEDSPSYIKQMLEYSGENVGVGSNRVNGYGRFKVVSFEEQV